MKFDQEERALFAALADVLVPAGDGMPSASQAGVADQWLDAVIVARPDLVNALKDVLGKARQHNPSETVAEWRSQDQAAFEVLAEIVPAAYFMNPEVQQAIGYAGRHPRPIDPRPDYMDHGLLESVIRRGPIYRPTPSAAPPQR
jgi:hypothetical protein